MPPIEISPIDIPTDKVDYDTITLVDDGSVSNCTHPAGHCYGSDGGSGIPKELKVAVGQGGEKEVWKIDKLENKITSQEKYLVCQYCGKYSYSETL